MVINADSTRVVEVKNNRGIQGSTAINAITDGFCQELENASLGQVGVISKRPGYNLHGCELPIKCRKWNLLAGGGGNPQWKLQMDSTPILTMDCVLYKNIAGKLNELVPEYFNSILDDHNNTVICQFTNLPTEITLTTNSLFETRNGLFFTPLFVANTNTVLFSVNILPEIAANVFGNPGDFYENYPLNTAAWTETVITGNKILLHSGAVLPSLDASYFSSITDNGGGELEFVEAVTTGLQVGDAVFLENSFYKLVGGGDPDNVVPIGGVVTKIVGSTITMYTESTVNRFTALNYFRMYVLAGRGVNLLVGPISYTPNYSHQSQIYTFTDFAQTIIDTSSVNFSLLIRPTSANTINCNPSGTAVDTDRVSYLFGTRANPGYVNMLNKYFKKSLGAEVLLCSCNGNLFEETPTNVVLDTLPTPTVTLAQPAVTPDPITLQATFVIPNAAKVYLPGDIVFRTTLVTPGSAPVEESYVVVSASGNNLVVQALTTATIALAVGNRWKIRRTSNKVFTKWVSGGVSEILDHYIIPGMTIQVGNYGDNYAYNTIISVNRTSAVPAANSPYQNFITLNSSVTWESDSKLYLGKIWAPVFYGTGTRYDHAPLTSSLFEQNTKDLYATNFDYSLYIPTGVDGVWRYDGTNLANINLPAPPLAYWRNIPGSNGFLPITLGENGKYVGQQVNIRLTYYYVDSLARVYESPVSPNDDITILTESTNEHPDVSKLVEIRVPSIPQGVGYPADKIKIRAYRPMSSGTDNAELYSLDAEVDNAYHSSFTSIIVGKTATLFAEIKEQLYSEIDEAGSNRPAPNVEIMAVLDNKLVGANGYEPPQFSLTGEKIFSEQQVGGALFAAFAKLQYFDLKDPNSILTFCTVPFTATKTAYDTAGLSTFMGKNFGVLTPVKYEVNGSFTIDYANGIKYEDTSNQFKLKPTAAVDMALTGGVTKYKLRTISDSLRTATIKFNADYFTASIVVIGGGNDEMLLAASTKWNEKNTVAVVGTDEKKVLSFYQLYTTPDSLVGASGTTNTGGIKMIQSSNGTDPSTVQLWIRAAGYTLDPATNDLIVIHMTKKNAAGDLVDKTLGNVHIRGATTNLSLNADVTWKVTARATDTSGNWKYYTLALVSLNDSGSTVQTFDSYNVDPDATLTQRHGGFDVYKQDNLTCLPVLKTDSFTNPSNLVTFRVGSDPTAATPTAVTVGEYLTVNFFSATGPNKPDFTKFGFPNCSGTFKVHATTANSITLEMENPPTQIAPPTTTVTDTGWAGAIFRPLEFVNISTSAYSLSVKVSAAPSASIRPGDWHFLLFRGWEASEISTPISGWFKVFQVNVANKIISYEFYEFFEGPVDYSLFSGFALASIVYMLPTVVGSQVEHFIPVPVPYKEALSQELQDPAWPMFEQQTDAEYNPLMGVARRFALALNSVLNNVGFANWGGDTGSTVLYPTNGFSFVAHKYPINRYDNYVNFAYVRPTITTTNYTYPFSTFKFFSYNAGYYQLYANLRDETISETEYVPKTQNVAADTTGLQAKYHFTFASTYFGSRLWWSNPSSKTALLSRITVFKYSQYRDINSFDGENIVGAVPYQTYLVVAKNNSIFRISSDNIGADVQPERAQSTVGVLAGKNMVATESYLYFLHNTGVYKMDGLNISPETTLNRFFTNRVYPSIGLLAYSSGYHDPLNKELALGTPYARTDGGTVSLIDGQFMYNYNDGVNGWSVNLNIPATWWVRRFNSNYFATPTGRVFKIREELATTKYRDYESAIAFRLRTRYVDMDDTINFKFIRNFIFQLGLESTQNITVNYTWDYFKDTKALTVIPLSNASYLASPYSAVTMVSNKYLKPVRGMVQPNRVAQLGLEIINAELDAKTEIFGVFIEGQVTNTRLVTQKNQTR